MCLSDSTPRTTTPRCPADIDSSSSRDRRGTRNPVTRTRPITREIWRFSAPSPSAARARRRSARCGPWCSTTETWKGSSGRRRRKPPRATGRERLRALDITHFQSLDLPTLNEATFYCHAIFNSVVVVVVVVFISRPSPKLKKPAGYTLYIPHRSPRS